MSLEIPLAALLVLVALRIVLGVAHAHLDRVERSLVPAPVDRQVRTLTPRVRPSSPEERDLAA